MDKDTGAPLAGGYIQFWEDADRTVPKLVYEKQNIGSDPVTGQPVYQYVALPNPVILSGVGTIQDANGNDVALYYYPYDANGNLQLYYVAVFNSLGVPQFTREGWPDTAATDAPGITNGAFTNMLLNPQFANIDFNPSTGISQSYSGSGTLDIDIGADWVLVAGYTGSGTITVNRISIAGSQNFLTNPPYVLQIVPGANLSSLTLIQKLNNNPGIWSPQTAGVKGYVASYILLGPGTSATILYAPNIGASTTLLTANNLSSVYTGFANTVQLPPSTNTDTADTGYVDISIELSTTNTSLLTSVQVLGLDQDIQGIDYVQTPVNLVDATSVAFEGVNVQVFTTSGTYTPSANMQYCIIECVAGGGGGGGTASAAGSTLAAGAGGGGGSYARKSVSAAIIGTSQVVTIGASGAGGTAGNNNGGNGGNTSVGTICVANGGSGGSGNNGSSYSVAGLGGAGGTGDITLDGSAGAPCYAQPSSGTSFGALGYGGVSGGQFGSVGIFENVNTPQSGPNGIGYGAGGGGGISFSGNGAAAGGNGTAGVVIITEYISLT